LTKCEKLLNYNLKFPYFYFTFEKLTEENEIPYEKVSLAQHFLFLEEAPQLPLSLSTRLAACCTCARSSMH